MIRRCFLSLVALAAVSSSSAVQAAQTSTCASASRASSDYRIRELLERLYRTFSYARNEEPDWVSMRSCFMDGAVFIGEPALGQSPITQDVDEMIAKWQGNLRNEGPEHPGYTEVIVDINISQCEVVAHIDIFFRGRATDDVRERGLGLDSVQLIKLDKQWKISAFIVQRESRLEKS